MSERLGVHKLQRNWAIYPVTAIKDHETSGLVPAMEWLVDNIDLLDGPRVKIQVGWLINLVSYIIFIIIKTTDER